MGGKLNRVWKRFWACYRMTGNWQQSKQFAVLRNRDQHLRLQLRNGYVIELRKNETDQEVFLTTFIDKFHRPPVQLSPNPVILDLGCNIGLTMVDFKSCYPGATILGVEMDRDNFELARTNTMKLEDCQVVHAAVWKANGQIRYTGINEQSYAIDMVEGNGNSVRSITMYDLIRENHIKYIDYIKMDIEGAEKAILLEADPAAWLEKTGCLSIEMHDTTDTDSATLLEMIKDKLQHTGFSVYKDSKHWCTLIAVKEKG